MAIAALPLIMAGAQAGLGLVQRASARRRREKALSDMEYDIPSAVKNKVQLATEMASRSGLPGEDIARGRMESGIAETLAKGEAAAQAPQDVMDLYANLGGKKMDITREILEQGAQYKTNNELLLQRAMDTMAEAENQQFYYNRFVPFLSEMGYAGQEAAGGGANIAGGLQTAYSTWLNDWNMNQFKEMYGMGGGGGTPGGGAGAPAMSGSFGGIDATGRSQLNQIAAGAPQATTALQAPRSEFSPWDTQDWMQTNPINYPASWLKYR